MAERLLPLGSSGLAFFFCAVLVLACASLVGSSAVGKFSSSLCPSVRRKKRKRPHARETHRILCHPNLNYIKVHLTPTEWFCFPPLWSCLTHSLFLSAVSLLEKEKKRKEETGAFDQLSIAALPLSQATTYRCRTGFLVPTSTRDNPRNLLEQHLVAKQQKVRANRHLTRYPRVTSGCAVFSLPPLVI
ncbi:hypothetical protein V8C35DRAFT_61594 [Trichoderma chlorosporum]